MFSLSYSEKLFPFFTLCFGTTLLLFALGAPGEMLTMKVEPEHFDEKNPRLLIPGNLMAMHHAFVENSIKTSFTCAYRLGVLAYCILHVCTFHVLLAHRQHS
jgi:hypothetical protein